MILLRISLAALLVNVIAKISSAGIPLLIKLLTLAVNVIVLPVPAPATTKSGPSICSAASFCSLFKLFKMSFGVLISLESNININYFNFILIYSLRLPFQLRLAYFGDYQHDNILV